MENKKAIEAIKEIRKREYYHYEKSKFCREHNMKLDEQWHISMEQEMRRLASKIEDTFDTGYISINND